jgi:hypothetical protein
MMTASRTESSVADAYPLLHTPAYLLTHSAPAAYAIAEEFNAVLFTTALVPAFMLARRVLPNRWAVGVAVATLFIPRSSAL